MKMSENKDFVTELDERLETHAEDIQRIRGSIQNGEQVGEELVKLRDAVTLTERQERDKRLNV